MQHKFDAYRVSDELLQDLIEAACLITSQLDSTDLVATRTHLDLTRFVVEAEAELDRRAATLLDASTPDDVEDDTDVDVASALDAGMAAHYAFLTSPDFGLPDATD